MSDSGKSYSVSTKRTSDEILSQEIPKKSREDSSENEEIVTETLSKTVNNKYMVMKDGSKIVKKSFKNPFLRTYVNNDSHSSSQRVFTLNNALVINKNTPSDKLRSEISRIKDEMAKIDKEIKQSNAENYEPDYLEKLTDKLHLYNDVKDVTQTLLERMAHIKGATIREMHIDYGLNPDLD
jgi:hypothetical protein